MSEPAAWAGAFTRLRDFARTDEIPLHRCELCTQPLSSNHRHLFERSTRQVACACDACALLFANAVDARYAAIPRDPRRLDGDVFRDEEWEALALPINLAYMVRDATADRVKAYYPSPAGVTESLVALDGWSALKERTPALGTLSPDVEALLVNRLDGERAYFIAPIDVCYELVGLVRVHWRGLSGGDEMRNRVRTFFQNLRSRAGCRS